MSTVCDLFSLKFSFLSQKDSEKKIIEALRLKHLVSTGDWELRAEKIFQREQNEELQKSQKRVQVEKKEMREMAEMKV